MARPLVELSNLLRRMPGWPRRSKRSKEGHEAKVKLTRHKTKVDLKGQGEHREAQKVEGPRRGQMRTALDAEQRNSRPMGQHRDTKHLF